jgi:hypothetical protein
MSVQKSGLGPLTDKKKEGNFDKFLSHGPAVGSFRPAFAVGVQENTDRYWYGTIIDTTNECVFAGRSPDMIDHCIKIPLSESFQVPVSGSFKL